MAVSRACSTSKSGSRGLASPRTLWLTTSTVRWAPRLVGSFSRAFPPAQAVFVFVVMPQFRSAAPIPVRTPWQVTTRPGLRARMNYAKHSIPLSGHTSWRRLRSVRRDWTSITGAKGSRTGTCRRTRLTWNSVKVGFHGSAASSFAAHLHSWLAPEHSPTPRALVGRLGAMLSGTHERSIAMKQVSAPGGCSRMQRSSAMHSAYRRAARAMARSW